LPVNRFKQFQAQPPIRSPAFCVLDNSRKSKEVFMTTDLTPDSPGRGEESKDEQRERTGAKRPLQGKIPSKQEILRSLAKLPGLVALGVLKPAAANAMRAAYAEMLRSLDGGAAADTHQPLVGSDVLAHMREHPELIHLLGSLLTDEQVDLLMAETSEDKDGQA
jgi:hypothetical protein